MSGSLNQVPSRGKEKSKVITIDIPANNATVESAIDNELNKGWHIATSFYDTGREKFRVIFTKLKRN